MKINKGRYAQLTAGVAIACLLTITGCATATSKKVQTNANSHKSNLDSATRANHSSLLDPSFYYSNHEISS